jgi:hypothetical protein
VKPMAVTVTRVLLHEIPAMLHDIVRSAIASQPDMALLRQIPAAGTPDEWRRPEPDVVIVSTRNINEVSIADWLNRWPRARLLAIEISGRETVMYELRTHATPLGALSPDQLVARIRERIYDWTDNTSGAGGLL